LLEVDMRLMSEKCLHVVRVVAVGLMATVVAGGSLPSTAEAGECRLCSKWKNLRAKCWPKRLSGGGMVVCEFRFSQVEPGFTAETPKDRETVAYTCEELRASRDVPEGEKSRILKQACPPVTASAVKAAPGSTPKKERE
jgi:hypothetical protein